MNIDIDKTEGKPTTIVATYHTWLEYNVEDLDIDWDKVKTIWCKYSILHIQMEDGTVMDIDYSTEGETDYKWPVQLQLVDEDYNQLWEE